MHLISKRYIIQFLLTFLLVCLLIYSCLDSKDKNPSNINENSTSTGIEVNSDPKTQEMITLVHQQVVSEVDVLNTPFFFSDKKIETLSEKLKTSKGSERLNFLFYYSQELLNAGRTEEAISVFKELLPAIMESDEILKDNLIFYTKKQLAIAYMRKGEQDNCIVNHNNESCIIPISPKAQHILREGSEQSIKILNELLALNPNDFACQYLLNIAHMTLGQYPDQVPDQFKIPESYFKASAKFPRFTDIAMNLGVDVNDNAGGTCLDDFNGDGYLDIIASSWGLDDQIKYFENDKMGGFEDKTIDVGLKGVTGGLNLRHADYNNDGHLDFLILRGAWLSKEGSIPNSLMRNNGDGTFTDITIEAGVYSLNPTQTAVWADVNLDGWVDLFIANEWTRNKQSQCELFLNQTDGTFKNIANESGITNHGYFKGIASGDVNNDLYPDFYLSDYFGNNTLYINTTKETGKPSFINIAEKAGVSNPILSFPTWIFDYNNDGFEDIFVSGYSSVEKPPSETFIQSIKSKALEYRPMLYQNNGNGTFKEVSLDSNLKEPIATMGCNFGDLDNDGFLDFYLATGDPDYYSIVPNKMYHNVNGKYFEDVTYSGGFGHIQKGHAIGFGDIDLDGDQDIYTVMGGAFDGDVFGNLLFENPIGNQNNWINIVLEGKKSNRSAIGAKIILTIVENGKSRKIYHSVGTDASFGGNSMMAEIGLGKAKTIEKIEIKWPYHSEIKSVFNNIEINQMIKVMEEGPIQKLNLPTISLNKEMPHHHH